MDEKWTKRWNEFLGRLTELADVLPDGLEGQALEIELRRTIDRLGQAGEALGSDRGGAVAAAAAEVLPIMGECQRWLRLISMARLVQSVRLEQLQTESQSLAEALQALAATKTAEAPASSERSAARSARSAAPSKRDRVAATTRCGGHSRSRGTRAVA